METGDPPSYWMPGSMRVHTIKSLIWNNYHAGQSGNQVANCKLASSVGSDPRTGKWTVVSLVCTVLLLKSSLLVVLPTLEKDKLGPSITTLQLMYILVLKRTRTSMSSCWLLESIPASEGQPCILPQLEKTAIWRGLKALPGGQGKSRTACS